MKKIIKINFRHYSYINSYINSYIYLCFYTWFSFFLGCTPSDDVQVDNSNTTDPSALYIFDLPSDIPKPFIPASNPMTNAKVELGRHLFYDKRLSGNATTSCESCHKQALAFSDGLVGPTGSTGEFNVRNSQSLVNVAYNGSYTWASPQLDTLEAQIIIPLFGDNPVEMDAGHNIVGLNDALSPTIKDRILADSTYQQLFDEAYPDDDINQSVNADNIVKALASFVRSLVSFKSPYDHYLFDGDDSEFGAKEQRGSNAFFDINDDILTECSHCHGSIHFTNSNRAENKPIAENPMMNTGLYNIGPNNDYANGDNGVANISNKVIDIGKFRPVSLRNLGYTAPYFHDGSAPDLSAVMDHYKVGGTTIPTGVNAGDGKTHPNKNPFIGGFAIGTPAQENETIDDIIAFLNALNDPTIATKEEWSNPW